MKIVSVNQMKEMETRAESAGLPSPVLMENAGRSSAREIEEAYRPLSGKKIMVLVGPGNNGADGLVAARYLRAGGARVNVILGAPRKLPDRNLESVREEHIPVIDAWKDLPEAEKAMSGSSIVVDSLFGTGKARAIEGVYKQMLDRLREYKSRNPALKVVSLDLPSGMDADTGSVDPSTCHADLTVTMAFPKRGFFALPGAEYLGHLRVVDIGIAEELAKDIDTELLSADWARSHLPARPIGAHKGTFGRVLVIGGSSRYFGAPYLACAGAYRAGAGLVTLASTRKVTELVGARSVETTYLPLPESEEGNIDSSAFQTLSDNLDGCRVILIGPGIGTSRETAGFLRRILSSPEISEIPVVLDADALNLVGADTPTRWQALSSKVILTPHPAEFARLSGLAIADIQRDRLNKAKEFAAKWDKVVVLKGAFTVVAGPEGHVMVSPWANPALATAGTGDVLSGIISGFLAQGAEALQAAGLGVYVHGLAGEMMKCELGEAGALASDLLPRIPLAMKKTRQST